MKTEGKPEGVVVEAGASKAHPYDTERIELLKLAVEAGGYAVSYGDEATQRHVAGLLAGLTEMLISAT